MLVSVCLDPQTSTVGCLKKGCANNICMLCGGLKYTSIGGTNGAVCGPSATHRHLQLSPCTQINSTAVPDGEADNSRF